MAHPATTNLKGILVGTACADLTVATVVVVGAVVCGVVCGVVFVVVVVEEGSANEDVAAEVNTTLDGICAVGILPVLLVPPTSTVVPGVLNTLVVGAAPGPVGVK